MNYIETLGKKAKCAEPFIASAQTDTKNAALVSIADALLSNTQLIIENNKLDLETPLKIICLKQCRTDYCLMRAE